jgi:hypothetical protein
VLGRVVSLGMVGAGSHAWFYPRETEKLVFEVTGTHIPLVKHVEEYKEYINTNI